MQLSNSFTIARPASEVYDAFLDIDRVATCMPGSTLIGQSGEDTYDGEVKVKVGPLSVIYTGQFTILDRDPATHTITMRAKGREKRGAGNADAYITATMTEADSSTTVNLATELNIRGKVAQFGRGAIADVTDSIMQTFAANVEQMLLSEGTAAVATTPPTSGAAPQPAVPESQPAPASPASAAGGDAARSGGELDVWGLIVRPALQRHVVSIVTIAMSGLAAYVGARRGARSTRRTPLRHHYY